MSTTTMPAPCWELRYTDQGEAGHFTTRQAAEAFQDTSANVDTDLRQLDTPCHIVICAHEGCGYRFDEEDAYITHFPSRDDALRWVRQCDWWQDSPHGPICQWCAAPRRRSRTAPF